MCYRLATLTKGQSGWAESPEKHTQQILVRIHFGSTRTSALGGGHHPAKVRDLDRGSDIVKAKLRGGRMDKQCKLRRYGGGVCATGYRKAHQRSDPECRLHGSTKKGSGPVRSRSPKMNPQSEEPSPVGGDNYYTSAFLDVPLFGDDTVCDKTGEDLTLRT